MLRHGCRSCHGCKLPNGGNRGQWMNVKAGDALRPELLSEAIFAGHIIAFTPRPELEALRAHAAKLIQAVLLDSRVASSRKLGQLRSSFRKDKAVHQLFPRALAACGVDLHTTFYDKWVIRTVDSDSDCLAPHRDTWASNVLSQINWWMPVYDICSRSTMGIFPEAFGKPVGNGSGTWDYLQLRKQKTLFLPVPAHAELSLDEGAWGDELRVVCPKGTMLAFSGAPCTERYASAKDCAPLGTLLARAQ